MLIIAANRMSPLDLSSDIQCNQIAVCVCVCGLLEGGHACALCDLLGVRAHVAQGLDAGPFSFFFITCKADHTILRPNVNNPLFVSRQTGLLYYINDGIDLMQTMMVGQSPPRSASCVVYIHSWYVYAQLCSSHFLSACLMGAIQFLIQAL